MDNDSPLIILHTHEHSLITPRLAVGSAVNHPSEAAALRADGFTHAVDCRDDAAYFRDVYAAAGIAHCIAATFDDGGVKRPEWFRGPVRFALDALRNPNTRVLVHCHMGINRGPSMMYAVLRLRGMSALEAKRSICMARPIVELAYMNDAEVFLADEAARR